ncbi:hypothetical protein ACFV3I_10775 [Microbacterium sp. NPDC059771]
MTLAVAGELSGAQLVLIGRLAEEHGLRVRPCSRRSVTAVTGDGPVSNA